MTPADKSLLEARAADNRTLALYYRNNGDESVARALEGEAEQIHQLCERL